MMSPFDEGMARVTGEFEQMEQRGVPEHVLDSLAQWVEDALPCYLRRMQKGGGKVATLIKDDRLVLALKQRVKQMGFALTMLVTAAIMTGCATPPEEPPVTGRVIMTDDFGIEVYDPKAGKRGMVHLLKGMVIETREEGGFEYVVPVKEQPTSMPKLRAWSHDTSGEDQLHGPVEMSNLWSRGK